MNDDRLPIPKRIAILLLSIDKEAAAKVLRELPDEVLDQVARAMKGLQDVRVDQTTVRAIHEEFAERLQSGRETLGNVDQHTRDVLERAFGAEQGALVGQRADQAIVARRPFATFETLDAEDLASLVSDEHPQIAAVFLAHLAPSKAGHVLSNLPPSRRAALVRRVASLERTPPDVVQRVIEVMRAKVRELGLTALRSEPQSWVKSAAEILNHMGGAERELLDELEESDPQLAGRIRDEMFTFDDLADLDRRAMQKVLAQVDSEVLALALKAAATPVERNVLSCLSKRAAQLIREERADLGPTPLSEVLRAQAEILGAVRDLIDRGEIRLGEVEEEVV
ncbi:MAG: flagellar motor switch protein FliG [Planctomycetes bacterium]|nr:flagellar motor switch protein FliG [Planctomycetota bacterium]